MVVATGPGGLAEELQLLVLRAANAAAQVQPESIREGAIARRALALRAPLAELRPALHPEGPAGDMGAMARWELAQLVAELDELAHAPEGEATAPVRLGAVRQRALGALLGLDRALATDERPALLGAIALQERKRALAVRAAFVEFRREVRALGEPSRGPAREQLLRIAGWLERLRDARGLRSLRIADRIQVESLLARIAATVDTAGEAAAVWRDIATFAEMALEVNRRVELREHDADLAGKLLRELEARPMAPEQIAFRRRLELLHGRDAGLDELLEEGGATAEAVRQRLMAIVRSEQA